MKNNGIIIDSHIFLWLLNKQENVGKATLVLLEESQNIFVSAVSLWELSLKHTKGKLSYNSKQLEQGMRELGVDFLELRRKHLISFSKFKIEHQDLFDVMLLQQAKSEEMLFVTKDKDILDLNINFVFDANR